MSTDPFLIVFCRHGEDGMTVHFNVHMDPAKGETMPEELTDVILGEILYAQNNTDAVLSDVVIDEESLDIQGKTVRGRIAPIHTEDRFTLFGAIKQSQSQLTDSVYYARQYPSPTLKLHIPLALAVPASNFTFTALSMHHSGHSRFRGILGIAKISVRCCVNFASWLLPLA